MLRSALLLLLALTVAQDVQAQNPVADRTSESRPAGLEHTEARPSGAVRHGYDPRLWAPVEEGRPLTPVSFAEPMNQVVPRSHWKAGAITGGILGGAVGFGLGYTMDNIINDGQWSIRHNSIAGVLLGTAVGALLGARVGSLVPR